LTTGILGEIIKKIKNMDLMQNIIEKVASLPISYLMLVVILTILILLIFAFFDSREPKKKKWNIVSAREIEKKIYEQEYAEKKVMEDAGNISNARRTILLKKIELTESEREKIKLN